jgi:hypothetical protein
MTDDLQRDSTGEDVDEIERGVDAPLEPDGTAEAPETPEEPNPLLKEGADAPDAADIEDPDEQL